MQLFHHHAFQSNYLDESTVIRSSWIHICILTLIRRGIRNMPVRGAEGKSALSRDFIVNSLKIVSFALLLHNIKNLR